MLLELPPVMLLVPSPVVLLLEPPVMLPLPPPVTLPPSAQAAVAVTVIAATAMAMICFIITVCPFYLVHRRVSSPSARSPSEQNPQHVRAPIRKYRASSLSMRHDNDS